MSNYLFYDNINESEDSLPSALKDLKHHLDCINGAGGVKSPFFVPYANPVPPILVNECMIQDYVRAGWEFAAFSHRMEKRMAKRRRLAKRKSFRAAQAAIRVMFSDYRTE